MLKKYFISIGICLVFFFAYSKISLELYHSHQTRGDLTAYAQGMWNTLHGHFMASTYNYSVHNFYDKEFRLITAENSNILGIHFNPILLFFVPLYAFFPHPEALLILQSFLVAGGGWLMYLLASRILKNETLSLTIQLAYLLYFATVSAVLSQFHAYSLSLFFAPLLLLASHYKNQLFYYGSLIAFLLVQENTSLVATFFGIYLALAPATRKRGLHTILLSSLYFALSIYYVIPFFSPYHFYLFSGIYGSALGGNIHQMVINTLHNPSLFVQSVFTMSNLTYARNLLLPIIPFALGAPLILLVASSSLAQNILSSSLGLKTQQMHYESGAVAFLFYGLILGLSFFLTKTTLGKFKHAAFTCLLIILTITTVSYKKFTSPRFNPTLLTLNLYGDKNREMDSLITQIPDSASVSTQDYLSAQLAGRSRLYQFPVYADQVEYLLLSKGDAVWPLTPEEHAAKLNKIYTDPAYQIVGETTHFVLFSRVSPQSQ